MKKLAYILIAFVMIAFAYTVNAQDSAVKSDLLIQFVSQNADGTVKLTRYMRFDQGDDCDSADVNLAWSSNEHEDMVVVRHCVTPTAPVPDIEMGTFSVVVPPLTQ